MLKIINSFLFFCLASCSDQMAGVVKTGLEGRQLPSYSLLLMDSTSKINMSDIPSGKPFVVFLFSPDCPYCRVQTQEIIDHMKHLSRIHFYFISNSTFYSIKRFFEHYKLKSYSNITVGTDFNIFFSYFKVTGVPFIAIYNGEKKLKQVLIGKSEIETIKAISLN